MQVYHLTEFVIGELQDEDTYCNFTIITSIVSVCIILFMALACLFFFLSFLLLNKNRFCCQKIRNRCQIGNSTLDYLPLLFRLLFSKAQQIPRKKSLTVKLLPACYFYNDDRIAARIQTSMLKLLLFYSGLFFFLHFSSKELSYLYSLNNNNDIILNF